MLGFTIIGLSIASIAGALLLLPIVSSGVRASVGRVEKSGASHGLSETLSIIIPARNEEHSLPALLASLEAQSIQPLEVIVVDDQSEDDTRLVAERHGARVIAAPVRPEGWLGKPWAGHNGAAAARGDLLLFLDADVALERDAIAVLLRAFESKQRPHDQQGPVVSAQPYHRTRRPYEKLALFFNVQVFVGAAHRTRGLELALEGSCCYGPCILCSRGAYDSIGGHAAVRSCVLEDIELGRRFQEAGIGVYGYSGRGVVEFRMYPDGFRSMVNGFSKNMLLGALRANPWFFFLDVFWMCGLVAAPALFAIAVGIDFPAEMIAAGAFYLVLVAQVWIAGRLLGNFGLLPALLYPIPLLAFLYVGLRVTIFAITGRQIQWKGRGVSPRASKP